MAKTIDNSIIRPLVMSDNSIQIYHFNFRLSIAMNHQFVGFLWLSGGEVILMIGV